MFFRLPELHKTCAGAQMPALIKVDSACLGQGSAIMARLLKSSATTAGYIIREEQLLPDCVAHLCPDIVNQAAPGSILHNEIEDVVCEVHVQ